MDKQTKLTQKPVHTQHNSAREFAYEIEWLLRRDLSNTAIHKLAQMMHRAQMAAFVEGVKLCKQYPHTDPVTLWFTKGRINDEKSSN